MGRPRLASTTLTSRGAYRKNPHRARRDAVDNRALGDPPEHLNEAEKAAWVELAANATPDTLSKADRATLELTVKLLLKMRGGGAKGGELALLAGQLAKLGCTPADRTRVTPVPKPEHNEFYDI